MNQDELLERFWTEVINVAADVGPTPAGTSAEDLRRVARRERYAAVFDACFAFDEGAHSDEPSVGDEFRAIVGDLTNADEGVSYRRASRESAPDAPFADADESEDRLFAAGYDVERFSALRRHTRRTALERRRGSKATSRVSTRASCPPIRAVTRAGQAVGARS
jgi:hypothetical protein